ncbi:hypothetical protein D3C84_717660 [compost metagenome]
MQQCRHLRLARSLQYIVGHAPHGVNQHTEQNNQENDIAFFRVFLPHPDGQEKFAEPIDAHDDRYNQQEIGQIRVSLQLDDFSKVPLMNQRTDSRKHDRTNGRWHQQQLRRHLVGNRVKGNHGHGNHRADDETIKVHHDWTYGIGQCHPTTEAQQFEQVVL